MLKRAYLGAVLIMVVTCIAVAAIAQIFNMKNDEPPLILEVRTINGATYSKEDVPLEIVFHNKSEKPIRLLNIFDQPDLVKIFFSLDLTDNNETPIDTLGGGKVSLSKDSIKYIELQKGETHSVKINLKEFLPPNVSFKPETYKVSVKYRNQYGENCFKGTLESNSVDLHLTGE